MPYHCIGKYLLCRKFALRVHHHTGLPRDDDIVSMQRKTLAGEADPTPAEQPLQHCGIPLSWRAARGGNDGDAVSLPNLWFQLTSLL